MLPVRIKNIARLAALLLVSLLLMQFLWRVSTQEPSAIEPSADKINLALRRTAHLLLAEAGDSTSRIAPVQQLSFNTWIIRLDHPFDYDQLPEILQSSLDLHGIQMTYDVAVLRCEDGELLLGYTALDYTQNNSVACGGRDMESGCYHLKLVFAGLVEQQSWWSTTLGMLALGSLMVALLFGLARKERKKLDLAQEKNAAIPANSAWLHFGNCRLDIANLRLICGSAAQQLTYREAKLLHLFASQPNQLLERSLILQNVWADEGIIVGRSVDVFVSRLRKLLRDDPSVRIAAVHGVGYRLEISPSIPHPSLAPQ